MKYQAILLILCCLSSNKMVYAQSDLSASEKPIRRGFYLSLSLGPAFGTINGKDNGGNNMTVSGTGGGMDIQIGGAIYDNLFLHGSIIVKTITGPVVNGVKKTDAYSFDESVIGAGVTKYLDHNFFLTGTIGMGQFTRSENNVSANTSGGLAMQLKAGKEWWVSQRWALGISAQYSFISLTNRPVNSPSEKWSSDRFGISFNATMVRYR